ncbi:hypothetical protein Taro_018845, partial [Colocasia esculenta]|nr:hypothetical protein [Colocasia esculenta]
LVGGGGAAKPGRRARWVAGALPAREARWREALLSRDSSSAAASAASRDRGCRLSSPLRRLTSSLPPHSTSSPYKYPMRGEGKGYPLSMHVCMYCPRCGTSGILYRLSADGDLTLVDVNSSVLAAYYRQALDLVDAATSGTSVPSSDTQAVASGTTDSEFQVVPSLPGMDTSDSLS